MTEQMALAERPAQSLAVSESAQLLSVIAAAARDPQCDVEKMRALLKFKQEIDGDEARKAYWRAMAEMSAEMPRVKKDGKIDLGSKGSIPFSTWDEMDRVIRPILKKHGFSLSFPTRVDGSTLVMACVVSHIGGHSERSEAICKPDPGHARNETQAVGSGRSYAKRYLTKDMLNIVTEGVDDDGKASGFISTQETDKIYALLDGCELSAERRAAWLKYMGVDLVEHVQKFDYDRAVSSLRAELKKQGKQLA